MNSDKSLLIIEDDRWFREYLEKIFNSRGFTVDSTANSYEAIKKIDENIPRVILLDILLPGANGVALLNEISTYSDTRTIPVVVCTSIADSIPIQNLDKYSIKKVFDKSSLDPEELVEYVAALAK